MAVPTSVCIGAAGHAAVWAPVVRMGGIDITSQVVGDILVDAEEGAARIADLSIRPPAATVLNLAAWTGISVEIDVADFSTGSPTSAARLFTGIIDTPTLDQASRLIALRCTDDLQGRLYAMSNAAIDTLIGGYWSAAIFDETAKGWTRAQDRLSTTPHALDVSPLGTLRLTALAAKTVADIDLDASLIGEQSITPQIADAAGLTNQVLIDFGYRFPRVKAETHHTGFNCVEMIGFATFILDGKSFLQRAQVEAAIKAAGGTIESITYTPLPTGIIAVGLGYWTPGPYDNDLCMGFVAAVSFDYAQTTEEAYEITVGNAASIAAIGVRQSTLSGALEGVYPDLTAVENNIRLYQLELSSNPPSDVAPRLEANTTAADVTLTPESNRAAAEAAMACLIAIAKERIIEAHRRNRVGATVPLIPALDLDKTIRVDADGVQAKGKCVRIAHRLSTDSGAAVSEFSIAISALSGVGVVHPEDPTTAPAGTTPSDTPLATAATYVFNNAFGADSNFTITFPQVENAQRNNAVVPIASSVAAPILEDEFVVTL